MEKMRNIPATDLSVFGVENPTSEISKSIYESYKDLFINESLCSDKGESYFLADFSYDLPSASRVYEDPAEKAMFESA